MKIIVAGAFIILTSSLFIGLAAEREVAKKATPRAYVHSGGDGIFYARCIPAKADGDTAGTDIFRVNEKADELQDHYEWFAPGGVVLGWSPITGAVSVLAIDVGARQDDWRAQEALRISAAGKLLMAYTAADLLALGAKETADFELARQSAGFRVIGCEQVPNTNDYDFIVELGQGKRLRFDILTGKLRTTGEPRPEASASVSRDHLAARVDGRSAHLIPVTVAISLETTEHKSGATLPAVVTIANFLAGPIKYPTYSLKPNGWNGETANLALVDVYREGETKNLGQGSPKINPPRGVAGLSWHQVGTGESLALNIDISKWKVDGGWKPGRYRIKLKAEGLDVEDSRCTLSVLSAPIEFEIQ